MLLSKIIIFKIGDVILFVTPQLGVEGPLTNKRVSANSENCEFLPTDPCHRLAFLVEPIVRADVNNYISEVSFGFF